MGSGEGGDYLEMCSGEGRDYWGACHTLYGTSCRHCMITDRWDVASTTGEATYKEGTVESRTGCTPKRWWWIVRGSVSRMEMDDS